MTTTLPAAPPQTVPASPRAPRNARLDILRGIAVLFVLNFHFLMDPHAAGKLRFLAIPLQRFGWTGVDLFFVLSGFLVGGLLFEEIRRTGRLRAGRFLIRRGFKIWPAYFVYLAAATLITGASLAAIAPNLLHIQNYLGTPFGHTWSLAVEEHFYLALPLLITLLLAFRTKTNPNSASAPDPAIENRKSKIENLPIPFVALALILLCTALRFLFVHDPATNHDDQWPTHIRIDSLFMGVTLGYFHHFRPALLERLPRPLLTVAGLLLVAPMAIFPFDEHLWIRTIGYTMLYLGYGCLLIAFLHSQHPLIEKISRSFPGRALAFVGFFSYSIYLWHNDAGAHPLAAFLDTRLNLSAFPPELHWLALTTIYGLIAIALGVTLGKLIEVPSLALRNRLFPTNINPA